MATIWTMGKCWMNLNFFVSAFFMVKGELCFKKFHPSQELSKKRFRIIFYCKKKVFVTKKLPTHLSHTKSTQIEIIDRPFQHKFIIRSDWTIFHGKNSFSLSLFLIRWCWFFSAQILLMLYKECIWHFVWWKISTWKI